MRLFRQQPPAYSPIRPGQIIGALAGAGEADASAQLCRMYGADQAVLCGSGTQALTVALLAAVRATGSGIVALPAFGCYDLASAAIGAGMRVRLYDVDPTTLGPDMDAVRRAVREGAGIIVIAPLYGVPVDWDQVSELARETGAFVIEDAAQGHGAAWRGRPLGGLGELSVISFGRGKGWTAGGGGSVLARGMVVDEALAAPTAAEAFQAAAGSMVQWALGRPAVYGIPASIPALGLGRTVYREPRKPRSLTRFGRRLLMATHQDSVREAEVRSEHGQAYCAVAREAHLHCYRPPAHSRAGYIRFPILTSDARAATSPAPVKALGIAASYPRPLTELSRLAAALAGSRPACPGARALATGLITLPTHSRLSKDDFHALHLFLLRGLGKYSPQPVTK